MPPRWNRRLVANDEASKNQLLEPSINTKTNANAASGSAPATGLAKGLRGQQEDEEEETWPAATGTAMMGHGAEEDENETWTAGEGWEAAGSVPVPATGAAMDFGGEEEEEEEAETWTAEEWEAWNWQLWEQGIAADSWCSAWTGGPNLAATTWGQTPQDGYAASSSSLKSTMPAKAKASNSQAIGGYAPVRQRTSQGARWRAPPRTAGGGGVVGPVGVGGGVGAGTSGTSGTSISAFSSSSVAAMDPTHALGLSSSTLPKAGTAPIPDKVPPPERLDPKWASTLETSKFFTEPKKAREAFAANGQVALLKGAVCPEGVEAVRRCCDGILKDLLRVDQATWGNRGYGRYSMGAAAASGQQLHHPEWAWLLSDAVLDALDSIYGGPDKYVLRGGGGEIVLGDVDDYQDLHADVSRQPQECDALERPPVVVVNFLVHDLWEDHGPTRLLPGRGRPRDLERPPKQANESAGSLRSTLAPMPAGSCVVRDSRLWHGGTPNRRPYPRYLPNLEFFSIEYQRHLEETHHRGRFTAKCMPKEVFQLLSPRAKKVAADLVALDSSSVPRGVKANFVQPQGRALKEQLNKILNDLPIGGTYVFSGSSHQCYQAQDIVSGMPGFNACIAHQGRGMQVFCSRFC